MAVAAPWISAGTLAERVRWVQTFCMNTSDTNKSDSISGGPFPASTLAVEDTEIAFISRRDFHAFCIEHPEVALKVLLQSIKGEGLI